MNMPTKFEVRSFTEIIGGTQSILRSNTTQCIRKNDASLAKASQQRSEIYALHFQIFKIPC